MPTRASLPIAVRACWTGRRLAITAAVWTTFALVQTVLSLIASPSEWSVPSTLLLDLLIAALWVALTPAIATFTALADRWTARPYTVLAAHLLGILSVSLIDTAWRRFLLLQFGQKLTNPFLGTMLFYADFAIIVGTMSRRAGGGVFPPIAVSVCASSRPLQYAGRWVPGTRT